MPEELSLLSPVESQTAACSVACSSWLSLELSPPDLCINHTSHICLLRGPGVAEQVLGCNVLNHDAHVVPIDVLDVAFVISASTEMMCFDQHIISSCYVMTQSALGACSRRAHGPRGGLRPLSDADAACTASGVPLAATVAAPVPARKRYLTRCSQPPFTLRCACARSPLARRDASTCTRTRTRMCMRTCTCARTHTCT